MIGTAPPVRDPSQVPPHPLQGVVTASVPSHRFRPGEKIGRYVLLEQVGQGGMGVVFAAFDPQLNRKIALKILQSTESEAKPGEARELRTRLFREAQAIAQLSHPNVITVFDVGTVGSSVFVAMEFVEGMTLTQWLEREQPLRAITAMFVQAGRGLSAAHQAGLVHRDFKPDNVLVGFDGTARVSDFGLARSDPSAVVDEDEEDPDAAFEPLTEAEDANLLSSPMTQTGAVVGTPRFMAPEQHAGARADPRGDQFAFCVALYHALYGQDPYVAHSMERLVQAKQNGRIQEPPQTVRVPGRLEQLVWRGLAPDPNRRYPTMQALLDDLVEEDVDRGRPMLRWAAALGLSGTVLGVAALQTEDAEEAPECKDGPEVWAELWSNERRQAVRAAFEVEAPAVADGAWTALQAGLDDYRDGWLAEYRDACAATRGRTRAADDRVFALRTACLDDRRQAVAAMLDVYEAPDDALLRAVAPAVRELPDVALCADVPVLLSRGPVSDDAQQRTVAGSVRGALMKAQVLMVAGKVEAAADVARRAVADADALASVELSSEARLVLGRAMDHAGQYVQAEAQLRDAVWAGTRAGRDDVAARGALLLVSVVGDRLGRHEEGRRWEEHARALLDRMGDQGMLRAKLENNAGSLDYRSGSYDAARSHYERALALRADALNDPVGQARWMVNLGNIALAQRRLGDAVEVLEEALASAESGAPSAASTRATILATLGLVHLEKEEYGAAREALVEAERGLIASLGEQHPFVSTARLNLAVADESLGRGEDAKAGFDRVAAALIDVVGEQHPAYREAVLGRARCARLSGHLDDAGLALDAACAVDDLVSDPLVILCRLERAELARLQGELEVAVTGFSETAAMYEQRNDNDPRPHAQALFGLAKIHRARGQRDEAANALAGAHAALDRVRGFEPKLRTELRAFETEGLAQAPDASEG
ncbi:MAG: serine/threonine-protein kinase [Myxococcota bacterium]